jgi:electron-transferring-flavoprotein dehydrogenase
MERESMPFDVVIVGAGPAGLATAIRLKQLAPDREVCVLEKGSEVGAHILSGAVLESRALDELIPDWKDKGAPITTAVSEEHFLFLTESGGFGIPGLFLPPGMRNHGNHIISLGNLCRWLGEQAEALGVEVYPGFAAAEVLYDEDGGVKGVATGDMGITKAGEPGPNHQPGMELHGKLTVFAEGCRGSLGKTLIERFDLAGDQPQTYGIGLKELWEIDPAKHKPGLIMHTAGWPLDTKTYGGSFLYHLEDNLVSVGFVIGLDYANPYLSPYEEFQRFKTHPKVRDVFEGGRRVAYGARALNEGGAQCLAKLAFPGGVLVGCEAGTLNMPKIKGTHTAMKSGMLAAEAIFEAFETGADEEAGPLTLDGYAESFRASWAWDELYRARNVRPAFKWGLWGGTLYTGIDQLLLRGRAPWTLRHAHTDHAAIRPAKGYQPIAYPKADGALTFDRLTNVSFSATNHEEDQPSHLKLADEAVPIATNLATYEAPEQRYCPAGVYEIIEEDGEQRLQVNAQNCLHCKTCDIKDPTQNITWTVPEGGGGPNYPNM